MRSRLHTVLVYFGLRDDDALEAELNAAPLTFWRVAAVAIALCLGLTLAFAVLSLVGVDFTRRTALTFFVFLGGASVAAGVAANLKRDS
jgi:hypothetical protein